MADIFSSGDFETLSECAIPLFGVEEKLVIKALLSSPNARGYIIGAISEMLLKASLEKTGLKVLRIKEKWEGEKKHHGDFYISLDEKKWYVIESKGLKSNSEKWAKTNSRPLAERAISDQTEMGAWYRNLTLSDRIQLSNEQNQSQIKLCQTHMPSGKKTNSKVKGRSQASPRIDEFHILAVDMYVKTGRHEFVYAMSDELTRSSKDPEHLKQNYFITFVLPSENIMLKPLATPWTDDLKSLVAKLGNPINNNDMQIDERKPGERAEGVISF